MKRTTLTKIFCWAFTILMASAVLSIPFRMLGMGVFAGALIASAVCWILAWGLATDSIRWGQR